MSAITLSVIVPMYNAAPLVERCLVPLLAMRARGEIAEIIVVNDCSTDRSADVVAGVPGVRLERTPAQGGPGAARNLAAGIATGSHLWFVDSDVIVADNAARVITGAFAASGAGAVFGCYDDAPAATNFLSQYKNLVHRYYHTRASEEASTFWAGCGAVERALFISLGGFDAVRYRYPSIEDIELGYRIIAAGRKIMLKHELEGKHLKEWRLVNLLHTEIFRRAIPWSQLMIERKHITSDLNVGPGERVRAVLSTCILLSTLAWAFRLTSWWLPAGVLAIAVAANAELAGFFLARRGLWFAARAFAYHQIYYLYSAASFAFVSVRHLLATGKGGKPSA